MRNISFLLLASLLLISCGASKYYVASGAEFGNLSTLLKKLDKDDNPDLRADVASAYQKLSAKLLSEIELYRTLTEPSRWDKILNAYSTLNKLSEVIQKSKARSFIDASSYQAAMALARQQAAEEYYELGLHKMQEGDKPAMRQAYQYLSKANEYQPGYKDVRRQMDFAWKKSRLNVVINPVTDQSLYYSQLPPNRFGNSFNSDLLQRSLVRDLGGDYSKNSPARFFTDREAYMANIDVDWIVDITWTDLDVPFPLTQTFSVNRSTQVEAGKDSTGKPIYQTVKATVRVTRRYFTARGEIQCRVTDAYTRDNIDLRRYHSQIDWSQNYATYSGDRRALTEEDLIMISNNMPLPSREAVLLELYQKIYPQLKNGIYDLVSF